jgi:hypothetical protein
MAQDSKKAILQTIKNRNYLNKDFDALRNDLQNYARTFFPSVAKDYTEAGFLGMMLDLAAYVGDVQSYYLDHQFLENFPDTAIETNNIERHLELAGVPIVGASPAVVEVTFLIKVPAQGVGIVDTTALPVIAAGTVVVSNDGVEFELTENIDFSERDNNGNLLAGLTIGNKNASNDPTSYILSRNGICISGFTARQSFSVGAFAPFKQFTLSNENVTQIAKVTDSNGNEYYEVEALTQDTVYKAVKNYKNDNRLVENTIVPTPAPYRFIKKSSIATRLTTLTFGGGNAETLEDDIIPDPSQFAMPLYGKKTISRFTIDPNTLLKTTTLGLVAPNTTITIEYRYGGGVRHNIEANAIRTIRRLDMFFPHGPLPRTAQQVRASIDVTNEERASGGAEAPTIDQYKSLIPAFKFAQGRIVTKQDTLARIYTMPSSFGRVYRASIQPNPNNPLASRLFVICKNADEQLITAPDTLKDNLATYLNEYRMISDAIDILDARILNLKLQFSIVVDPDLNRQLVLKNVLAKVRSYFSTRNFDIDQPIIIADVQNIIYNTAGVISVVSIQFNSIFGTVENRSYSSEQFDVPANTTRGIILPPPGGIFEIKFSEFDIVATAV